MSDLVAVDGGPAVRPKRRILRLLYGQGLLLILFALIVFFSTKSEYFLTSQNLLTIGGGAAALGIMAAAQTFLVISGGFDVSVGSVVAVTTVLLGYFSEHLNVWVCVALVLLVSGGIGLGNGLLVVGLDVNPLIATLGSYWIFSGLAFLIAHGQTLLIDGGGAFEALGTGRIGTVPVQLFILIGVFAMAAFVAKYTLAGHQIYAIGGNLETCRLVGMPVRGVRITLYVLSGLSAGVAGVLVASQLSAGSADIGTTYLLSVVTAVILGGTSIHGGRGTIFGTIIAVAILSVLENGFALIQVETYVQSIVLGGALVIAVVVDQAMQSAEN